MSYHQIKWAIFIAPALIIGIWEYVRHKWFLHYISMDAGNWLSPLIVLAVTFIVNQRLFKLLEKNQRELEEEKTKQVIMKERQAISRELHDSISQSLFLLSVKTQTIQTTELEKLEKINQILDDIHANVRDSIKQLRTPDLPLWTDSLKELEALIRKELPAIDFEQKWELEESEFTTEEKINLLAVLHEGCMNIIKHAKDVSEVKIIAYSRKNKKYIKVLDNGREWKVSGRYVKRYGIQMMKERAESVHWKVALYRKDQHTHLQLEEKE